MSPLNTETFLVWFNLSNKYVFLDTHLKNMFDIYFKSKNKDDFIQKLKNDTIETESAITYFDDISNFLKDCNLPNIKHTFIPPNTSLTSKTNITKQYIVDDLAISINYCSEKLMSFIHNSIAHLNTSDIINVRYAISILEDDNYFYLYLDNLFIEGFLKKEYHLLQGKLALIILNLIYSKDEHDWLGMFHASTVCNNNEAIMFVGDSGNGKSTFTALMVANGFKLVADDITPVLSNDFKTYFSPTGISIKEGSFKILKPYYKDFDLFPEFIYSTIKGKTKLLTSTNIFKKNQIKCNKIILVKYDAQAETSLIKVEPKKVLQTLIPDSWISPKDSNAKLFLDWINHLNFFELNYSNNDLAIKKVRKLLS